MSSIVIAGDTSGSVTLQAPATAGTTVLTLPATSGTVITTASGNAASATTATTATNLAGGSNGTIPYQSASGTTQMLAAGIAGQLLKTNGAGAPSWATVSAGPTLGTPVASTSGTSVTFTGIPSGTKQITVSFKGVSTSSFSQMLIRLGDAGGIETTGYVSIAVKLENAQAVANANDTDGFRIFLNGGSPVFHGTFILTLENSSTFSWTTIGFLGDTTAGIFLGTAGSKSLSQELTQVSITTANGTDTFDAGEINIAYI
jgi:hypothetical protein